MGRTAHLLEQINATKDVHKHYQLYNAPSLKAICEKLVTDLNVRRSMALKGIDHRRRLLVGHAWRQVGLKHQFFQ
jgi:hypothetical protein